jgi:hypothetical protein
MFKKISRAVDITMKSKFGGLNMKIGLPPDITLRFIRTEKNYNDQQQ